MLEHEGIYTVVVRFLAEQSFNNVLLAVAIVGAGTFVYWDSSVARPAIVKQITDFQEASEKRAAERASDGHRTFAAVGAKWSATVDRMDARHDRLVRELIQTQEVARRSMMSKIPTIVDEDTLPTAAPASGRPDREFEAAAEKP